MKISINDLPIEIHVLIFQYLPLFDLCECEKVSKSFYTLLLSPNASLLYSSINTQKRDRASIYTWLLKKLPVHNPSSLNFSGSRLTINSLTVLLSLVPSLTSLDISFHLLYPFFFESLPFLSLKSLTVNDAKLKDASLDIILKLPRLEYLNINYNSALTGSSFLYTSLSLRALWFEGCERIEYFNIFEYLHRAGNSVAELGIDGEYYSNQEVCTLLQLAPNLNKFAIEFANEMGSCLVEYLRKNDWKYLKIRRALHISQESFSRLFDLPLVELRYLNLAECTFVDDFVCKLIGRNCKRLGWFTLTWCSDVTDAGILEIVKGCVELEYIDLTGLKEITDLCFPLCSLEVYKKLEMIVLEKCNKMSDEHLWKMSEIYPRMKIKNYYGEFKDGWTGVVGFEMKYKNGF